MTPQSSRLVKLVRIKRTDSRLLKDMAVHYSHPKGFVGRNICYAVVVNAVYCGAIVGGSATLHLVGRDAYFKLTRATKRIYLNNIVNNIFFHIEPRKGSRYPVRNIGQTVLKLFREIIQRDWQEKCGDKVIGFESLVELPRTGEVYKRDGWIEVGITKGYTCKRVAGKGTDSWSGKRVWDVKNLRPKRVFVKRVDIQVRRFPRLRIRRFPRLRERRGNYDRV